MKNDGGFSLSSQLVVYIFNEVEFLYFTHILYFFSNLYSKKKMNLSQTQINYHKSRKIYTPA